ncbi:hypothetical protein GGI16_000113, partial [Coemansia sp. S142-1]
GYYDQEPELDNDPEPVLENDREPVHDQEPAHDNNWAFEGDNGGWEVENGNDWELEDPSIWEAECRNDGVPKTRYVYPPDTAANIIALVQWIKQMVPAVSEIDVDFHDEPEILHQYSNVHTLDLVQQLFDIVERRTVISDRNDYMLIYLDLEPIRDLVHLECSLDLDFYSA